MEEHIFVCQSCTDSVKDKEKKQQQTARLSLYNMPVFVDVSHLDFICWIEYYFFVGNCFIAEYLGEWNLLL